QVLAVRDYFGQALRANLTSESLQALGGEAVVLDGLTQAYQASFRGDAAGMGQTLDALVGARLDDDVAPKTRGDLDTFVTQAVAFVKESHEPFLETRHDFEVLLRGDDAERASFVDAYEYELGPCTDDAPFFFNYYKWREIFKGGSDQGETSELQARYHPDFPIGHIVLFASLAQILVLAGLLIFWPLRKLGREGVKTPGAFRYFVYFAALGLGFMFVEITLMQKLVIFLGHPTYALSVVLSSLLGFAGIGSFLAGRIRHIGRKQLFLMWFAIMVTIALAVAATNFVLPMLLGWTLPARVAICVALLLPLGLALGTAFPSGLRVLAADCPQLLPWGWAINGFLSVMATILCIILGQEVGFSRVLWIAAGVYTLGFLLMKPESRRREPVAEA
ncbi:MAG: hypothetical protein KDB53_19520, partial [Planctomycetes bacterium]|nr:hypothetical protein [Planctomycetota bacterium]